MYLSQLLWFVYAMMATAASAPAELMNKVVVNEGLVRSVNDVHDTTMSEW